MNLGHNWDKSDSTNERQWQTKNIVRVYIFNDMRNNDEQCVENELVMIWEELEMQWFSENLIFTHILDCCLLSNSLKQIGHLYN